MRDEFSIVNMTIHLVLNICVIRYLFSIAQRRRTMRVDQNEVQVSFDQRSAVRLSPAGSMLLFLLAQKRCLHCTHHYKLPLQMIARHLVRIAKLMRFPSQCFVYYFHTVSEAQNNNDSASVMELNCFSNLQRLLYYTLMLLEY